MIEICLIICCFFINDRFNKANEDGAGKYIGGIIITIIAGIIIGVIIGKWSIFITYLIAICIATSGMSEGNEAVKRYDINKKKKNDERIRKLEKGLKEVKENKK